jgi:hypothetical protein
MVKNLARLVLFFSLNFVVLFVTAAGLRYLALRVEWLRTLPRPPAAMLSGLITAGHWALSLALYGSLLLSLAYAARGRFFAPMTAVCLAALSLAVCFGISLALEHWEHIPPAPDTAKTPGEPGLILTSEIRHSETVIVLLEGPADPRRPRVTAIPGQPLLFQPEPAGPDNTVLSLPPIPFRNDSPWFLKSLAIDLRLSADLLEQRFNEGLYPFLIYAGALILFLCSLGCIFKLSAWPLANLFLGCLVFRGILALEIFFNAPEIQDAFESFLENRLPLSFAVPLIFCALGILVYLYSMLVYLAKRRRDDED